MFVLRGARYFQQFVGSWKLPAGLDPSRIDSHRLSAHLWKNSPNNPPGGFDAKSLSHGVSWPEVGSTRSTQTNLGLPLDIDSFSADIRRETKNDLYICFGP